MKAIYLHTIVALALTFGLAACIPASRGPAPTPPPVVRPAPTPTVSVPVVQQSFSGNYLDAPQTPGNWEYEDRGNLTLAVFSGPQTKFAMQCWRPSSEIRFVVQGEARANPALRIQTETTSRVIPAQQSGSEIANVLAALPANDPLLDAMAITKGRFAVEVGGMPTLYLPAWVEVSRVIEDCR